MSQSVRAFLGGVIITLIVVVGGGYIFIDKMDNDNAGINNSPANINTQAAAANVIIQSLPPLDVLAGEKVAFEGKKDLVQNLGAAYAENIVIVKFSATGENAQKSVIKIIWEDNTTQLIPAGSANIALPPGKRAKAIIISGYSMHERKIFRDSARPGTLTWDIRYEAAK